jgi:hypothetical protein
MAPCQVLRSPGPFRLIPIPGDAYLTPLRPALQMRCPSTDQHIPSLEITLTHQTRRVRRSGSFIAPEVVLSSFSTSRANAFDRTIDGSGRDPKAR